MRNKSHKYIKLRNKNTIILNNTIILHCVQTVNETLETHFKDNGTRGCCGPERRIYMYVTPVETERHASVRVYKRIR